MIWYNFFRKLLDNHCLNRALSQEWYGEEGIADQENRKFFTGFLDKANFFTRNWDPTPLEGPLRGIKYKQFCGFFWNSLLKVSNFGPRVYPMGPIVIALVRQSVYKSISLSLNILETAHWFSLIFALRYYKGTKVTEPDF